MAPNVHITTDHDEIRRWVEERGGRPALVQRAGDQEDAGALRIDFTPYVPEPDSVDISWDAFFQRFEDRQLAFLYQEEGHEGEPDRMHEFIERHGRRPS